MQYINDLFCMKLQLLSNLKVQVSIFIVYSVRLAKSVYLLLGQKSTFCCCFPKLNNLLVMKLME